MIRVLLVTIVIALALAAGAWALFLHSVDHGHPITVGVLEDAVKWSDPKLAEERVAFASRAGFNALNITTSWTPGQAEPDPGELELLRNVARAAQRDRIRLLITVYALRPRYAPMTEVPQTQYANYLARLASELPSVDGFAVWNEPNLNTFWLHQYDAAGNDIAAPAYTSLLAHTYDALKAVSPAIKVYGGNLAPRGFEDAESPRPTHSPLQFIRDMGTAYRASRRKKPIMDVFALHPYQTRSAIPPGQPHTGTSLGFGDYDELVALLGLAFDGTAQPGSKLPIAYTEFGVQSIIPPGAQGPYTNIQSPLAKDAVPEKTQAEYYKQAFEAAACQPNVIAVYIFHLFDEADLNRWQSGPYYTDTKPKSSLDAIASAAKKARGGKLADCS
ncbi:MAG TPA: hypothetical protein VKC65_08615 [Gaiellaceae bacterium]|nr:hypothetical protein [Gaiellaceae bacterium]